jgi:tetraacyldisaccharide 4'-kinase
MLIVGLPLFRNASIARETKGNITLKPPSHHWAYSLPVWLRTAVSRGVLRYAQRRQKAFATTKRKQIQLTVPVVGVGNLSTGGSGKSPLVQLVVHMLQQLGKKPGIVCGGYKRKGKGLVVVHDGDRVQCTVEQCGDEAMMHAMRCGNVPVCVHNTKLDAAVFMAGYLDVDCIVVDDAFQHQQLFADCSIVCVDTATMSYPQVVPLGVLREPLSHLYRADAVALMNAPHLRSTVSAYTNTVAPVIDVVTTTYHLRGQVVQRGIVCTAVANSWRVIEALKANGTEIVHHNDWADHSRFSRGQQQTMIDTAMKLKTGIIVTDKDAVKLLWLEQECRQRFIPFTVVGSKAECVQGQQSFVTLLQKIFL